MNLLYSELMFVRKLSIQRIDSEGTKYPCPIRWIDNFAMRNFTNDAIFDDTLPVSDGLLEAGHRVPIERLQPAMDDWFRRKGYLKAGEQLEITEIS
jgi:hypothetical protein